MDSHFSSDLEEGEIVDSPPPPEIDKKRKKLPRRYVVRENKNSVHKHKRDCKHSILYHAKKLSKLKKTPTKVKKSPKHHKSPCSREKSHKISCSNISKPPALVINSSSSNFSKPVAVVTNHELEFPKTVAVVTNHELNFPKPVAVVTNHELNFPRPVAVVTNHELNFPTPAAVVINHELNILKPPPITSQNISKPLISENGHSFSQQSLIAEIKSYFKSLDVNQQNTKLAKLLAEKLKNKNDLGTVPNADRPKIEFFTKIEKELDKYMAQNNSNLNQHNHSSFSENNVSAIVKTIAERSMNKNEGNIFTCPVESKDEESEDEEELRRIALATCAKRKIINLSENVSETNSYNVPARSDIHEVQFPHHVPCNTASDNYEVVDMEIDDDVEDSEVIIQTSADPDVDNIECANGLFVIDTNPSVDYLGNKENTYSEPLAADDSTDDDFEVDLLRADLIQSMLRKKFQDKPVPESVNNVCQKPINSTPGRKRLVNYQKPNNNFHRKLVQSAKHTLRKNAYNKSKNVKASMKKEPLPVKSNKPSQRLIIALNDETSSDDSDDAVNSVSENPVDSIVALISDCRQKSESNAEAKETVSKAVSCLSKAQQEEYTSLKKILAEKKKLPNTPDGTPPKNASVYSPLDDLKILEKKLVGLEDALKNKKQAMTSLSEDINSKKMHYMKAKLSVQHLKEQLVAAEKVRKSKLLDWSKAFERFKSIKKSVSDMETKICEVRNLCSKLGVSTQGQSYQLPHLPSGNEQS